MSNTLKTSLILGGIGVFAIGMLLWQFGSALGAPSFTLLNDSFKTAAATTTTASLGGGTGTTTLTIDSRFSNRTTAFDSAVLAIQLTASSAPLTKLRWQFESSNDNIDWYPQVLDELATSSRALTVVSAVAPQYEWEFASTTNPVTGVVEDFAKRVVNVPTPTRYTRVIFTMPVGSNNGLLWAEFTPKKEE
jgi:hypothetical protein|tara:strand:- start:70 stop:642 length:573 start_codon:yes stop_codon:yes gene_type:complete